MHEHAPRLIERHCDVLVVGGSAAGLAAALQLGRQRRSVIVVDAGEPRNAPAAHMHSFLGRDGTPPAELVRVGRDEVRSYGGEVLDGRVRTLARTDDDHLRAELVGGHSITARRVLVATGMVDVLPDIDGLAEHWGRDVVHCPFCHGYEIRDRRIVQVVTHPRGLHPAPLFRQLTTQLTVVVDGAVQVHEGTLGALQAGGVEVVRASVARVLPAPDGGLGAVELDDGRRIEADAVAVGPRFRVRAEPFTAVGLRPEPHPSGLGDHLVTDETGATSVLGIYAAGNVTDPMQQVLQAAADGSRVGGTISFDLADEDLRAAARPSAPEVDWDRRYSTEPVWSGNPNGALVAELTDRPPGRALDVGAGEGGDVLWLAERGWTVAANDISRRALDRIDEGARRLGHRIELVHADANDPDAFGSGRFDLVSAHYASIPRTADGRGLANVLGAVAPGGTLLVVSHDLAPMRAPVDTTTDSRAFDPDAYLRVADFAAAIADDPAWTVELHETRPRPEGAASAEHHVDDEVLRARRR